MTERKARKFTREELYDHVWTRPVAQLAEEWGLSNVGLAKLCRRHQVPLPYRGYWARKAAGQTPRPLPLPQPRGESHEDIWVFETPLPAILPPDPEIDQAISQEAMNGADVVPADLRGAHDLVRQCREALKDAGPDNYGRVGPRWNRHSPLAVNVGPASVNRVLRISDAIIRGALRRGYKLDTTDPRDTVKIVVRGCGFRFSFEEPSKLKKEVPEPPTRRIAASPAVRIYQHRRYAPSGRLKLHLGAYGDKVRTLWEDTETQQVEDCLADFFRSLAIAAVYAERRPDRRKVDIPDRQGAGDYAELRQPRTALGLPRPIDRRIDLERHPATGPHYESAPAGHHAGSGLECPETAAGIRLGPTPAYRARLPGGLGRSESRWKPLQTPLAQRPQRIGPIPEVHGGPRSRSQWGLGGQTPRNSGVFHQHRQKRSDGMD
jgi:hypothetical protein